MAMDATKNTSHDLPELQESLLRPGEIAGTGKTKEEIRRKLTNERAKQWRARNREQVSRYNKTYRTKNRIQILAREKRNYWTNPQTRRDNTRDWHKKHPEYGKTYREKQKIELRLEILNHYGKICPCCGETEPLLLSIDHRENGRGNPADRTKGTGQGFYAWLKRNGFPKGPYQILCLGCNQAKGFYGSCPHEALKTPIDLYLR